VHYYEQGNVGLLSRTSIFILMLFHYSKVQLATTHTISMSLPPAIVISTPSPSSSKILALVEEEEGKYQTSLNETYHEMGEKTFKGLRRALPLTRQKLDWDKVCGSHLLRRRQQVNLWGRHRFSGISWARSYLRVKVCLEVRRRFRQDPVQ
jgi:hypothetical protein